MLFNSNLFLYVFLPALLVLFYMAVVLQKGKMKAGNIIVLIFSLLFYFCTGGWCILILLGVVVFNYILGLLIERAAVRDRKKTAKLLLGLGVAGDIGILIYYKYAGFIYANYSVMAKLFRPDYLEKTVNIVLPVGISFFIFQAMSYVIDVYRKEVAAQRSLMKFTLYIALFPQLVAGPIVRYKTVCDEIEDRRINIDEIYEGVFRFVLGLGKKVLIADVLGGAVDSIWGLSGGELTAPLAWSAAFLYTLQIFFDFSGYSDMAIGLGRMLGFHFEENFVQPYTASNVNEFWRRWHVSLSSFLKDYLYIPLGGNRKGIARTYRNLFIVFVICGLWHGAAWNFVIWGIYHGLFQIIERLLKTKYKFSMRGIWGRIITFFVVLMGWVLFRAGSVSEALVFYKAMFAGSIKTTGYFAYEYYVYFKIAIIAIVAFIGSFFRFEGLRRRLANPAIKGVAIIVILIVSMAFMSDASFTPFIYFQF